MNHMSYSIFRKMKGFIKKKHVGNVGLIGVSDDVDTLFFSLVAIERTGKQESYILAYIGGGGASAHDQTLQSIAQRNPNFKNLDYVPAKVESDFRSSQYDIKLLKKGQYLNSQKYNLKYDSLLSGRYGFSAFVLTGSLIVEHKDVIKDISSLDKMDAAGLKARLFSFGKNVLKMDPTFKL